jgi:histidyl-tRNA synthetase
MALLALLWKAGISAELVQKRNPYFEKQLEYALDLGIPFLVLVGQTEVENETVNIKNTRDGTQMNVPHTKMVAYLRDELAKPQPPTPCPSPRQS